MASSTLLFVIVGLNEPLYEAELHKRPGAQDAATRQNFFVLHSALDLVERAAWASNSMYLKVVDKVNTQQVSAFVTASSIKLLLLHTGNRSEESIRSFFHEAYELYVKFSMNPFYRYDAPIDSVAFDTRLRGIARRYL